MNNVDLTWLANQFPNLNELAFLSRGGQKIVASAVDPEHGDVVLKLIRPDQDLETTRREILAVAEVQSPRVPDILSNGTVVTPMGECVWLLERRILGQNGRELLRNGALTPAEYMRMGLHVLEALVNAEAANIVHRDVKPDNIIRDLAGNYWLIDFGIARHLSLTSLTKTTDYWGKATIGYAPFEQIRNLKQDIDARTDLFALGITLYEAIVGVHPYTHPPGSELEVIRRMQEERNERILPLEIDVPGGLDLWDLISAMTQNRRDLRPRTAAEAFAWMREICTNFGLR